MRIAAGDMRFQHHGIVRPGQHHRHMRDDRTIIRLRDQRAKGDITDGGAQNVSPVLLKGRGCVHQMPRTVSIISCTFAGSASGVMP